MSRVRGVCAAVGAVFLLGAPAQAGDPNWAGIYAGIHGGYGWGNLEGTLTVEGVDPNTHFPPSAARSIGSDGGFAGLQAGYNLQSGPIVYGIEMDFSGGEIGGDLSATTQSFGIWGSYTKNIETQIELFATLRARAGVTVGSWLLYATGGLAWAQSSGDQQVIFNPGLQNGNGDSVLHATGTGDDSNWGWTIGGGAEVPIGGKWALKGEYMYADLGSVTYRFIGTYAGNQYHTAAFQTAGSPHTTDGFTGDLDVQTIRLGLNYRMN
jgi:outer membrane immunogenic protein